MQLNSIFPRVSGRIVSVKLVWIRGNPGGNLNKNDLDNQEIAIPSEEEKKKIGSFFQQLDNLITLHQRKVEKLQIMKKSMLEKMFV